MNGLGVMLQCHAQQYEIDLGGEGSEENTVGTRILYGVTVPRSAACGSITDSFIDRTCRRSRASAHACRTFHLKIANYESDSQIYLQATQELVCIKRFHRSIATRKAGRNLTKEIYLQTSSGPTRACRTCHR